MGAQYSKGDFVRIKSTNQIATISKVTETTSVISYYVMVDGKKKRYKGEDLLPYVDIEDSIFRDFENLSFGSADQLQRYIYFKQFSEAQDSNIYSYQNNKIIFNPFQYKPLMKFLSIDSDERILVADEVGVGKTIESGIIIDELIARGDLQARDSILIVCPNVLCRKWQEELKSKFQMDDFLIYDGKTFKYVLETTRETGKNPTPHGIVSEQLLRGERYEELLKACQEELGEPFIQMLIVDECHHYRNADTNTHKMGALLSLCSDRVVMLSATPYNLRSSDLFNQLNMLNPALFPDEHMFNILIKQIRNVNQSIALLRRRDVTVFPELLQILSELRPMIAGNQSIYQEFEKLYNSVAGGDILDIAQIIQYEKILNFLNPLASSFTRTLKRDAIAHRVTREVRTIEVHFTNEEFEIYRNFIDVNMLRHQLKGVSERAFGLITNGLERIAASSIVALERNINHFMHISDVDIEDNEVFESDLGLDAASVGKMLNVLKEEYQELIQKIHALNGVDSKYDALRTLVGNVWNMLPENPRIIVFSFYVGTLKYLRKKLSADGYRVALMYGKTPHDTPVKSLVDEDGFPIIGRQDIMKAFKNGEYDILLASEVGGEGLDFQFCSALINYDLPYNPMRIEQRIGRIDRMGQEADKIVIGNLCIADTIDMVINRVLLSRIDDATDLIGDLEPIIAKEMEEMNKLILRKEFTEEELERREQELIARIEKERITREEFDSQRYELVNDKSFRDEFEENIRNSRISPKASLLFTMTFLKGINGCWSKQVTETSAIIHITKDIREKLVNYYRRMNLGTNSIEIQRIYETEGDITINFDGDEAYTKADQLFVKPSGAWIRFMVDYIKALELDEVKSLFHVSVKQEYVDKIPKGAYFIFIYDFEFVGFRNQKTNAYVLVNTDANEAISVEEETWKNIFMNIQTSKRNVIWSIEDMEVAQTIADEETDKLLENIKTSLISSNDVKIVSRMEAIRKMSELRIREHQNNLIGASPRDAEKLHKAIMKEEKKTAEKLRILEEKRKLGSSSSLEGVALLEII